MPAPFNIIGIDHIVLRAVDPAALERFYLNVLGLSFEKREEGLTQLRAGNALVATNRTGKICQIRNRAVASLASPYVFEPF